MKTFPTKIDHHRVLNLTFCRFDAGGERVIDSVSTQPFFEMNTYTNTFESFNNGVSLGRVNDRRKDLDLWQLTCAHMPPEGVTSLCEYWPDFQLEDMYFHIETMYFWRAKYRRCRPPPSRTFAPGMYQEDRGIRSQGVLKGCARQIHALTCRITAFLTCQAPPMSTVAFS